MSTENDQSQCKAQTKSGKRCRRTRGERSRYCAQHAKMLTESLHQHRGQLDYIPKSPPVLSLNASGFWDQYCEVLLNHDLLMGHYLHDIYEICWRIDFREEIEKDIERHGTMNFYDNGLQPNGYTGIMDKNDKRITDLKKIYGLTLESSHKLKANKKQKQEPPKEEEPVGRTGLKSVKGW